MIEKTYSTSSGTIHYWVNGIDGQSPVLVFLPGLTADHRLFEKQIEYFHDKIPLLVWDAPGHGASRPFALDYSLADKARWLHEILDAEGIGRPVLVGQSMGGYVAQCFMELYPGSAAGFIPIDSAPLQRRYVTGAEIWMLKNCEWMYRLFPWKLLVKAGSYGCAQTAYGRDLMREMMLSYTHSEYCSLAGHGYRILAEAMDADLPYVVDCPALLICGDTDRAAAAMRYNRAWTVTAGLPIFWVSDAGHNSNTDRPDLVNAAIEDFCGGL